jgi:hypothetical protein
MKIKMRDFFVLALPVVISFLVMMTVLLLDKVSFGCEKSWVCTRSGAVISADSWTVMIGISTVIAIVVGVPIAATIRAKLDEMNSKDD